MDPQHFRPRSVSELIDGTIRIVRGHFKTLFPLALVAYLPMIALFAMIPALSTQTEPNTSFIVLAGILGFTFMFWFVLFDGAMVHAAMEAYLGRHPTAGASLRFAASRYWRILGANAIKYLAPSLPFVVVFALAAVVPGLLTALLFIVAMVITVLAFLRLAILPTTVIYEPNGVMAGVERSVDLTEGSGGRIFLSLLLVYFIWTAIYFVFYLAVMIAFLNNPVATVVIGQAAASLGYPLFATLIAMLYFDLRIRKEAYDIELMAQALPAGGPVSAST